MRVFCSFCDHKLVNKDVYNITEGILIRDSVVCDTRYITGHFQAVSITSADN